MLISTFLGNTGKKYDKTRHNIAWMVVKQLSFYQNLRWNNKFKAEWAKQADMALVIIKPQTLMNNSGQSVSAALSFFKEESENLLVIHDDLELPYGVIQFKKGGGSGGHNGLRSVIKEIGTSNFYRLRMGISRPPAGRDVTSWVLGRFSEEEEAVLEDYCKKAASHFEKACSKAYSQTNKIDVLNFGNIH